MMIVTRSITTPPDLYPTPSARRSNRKCVTKGDCESRSLAEERHMKQIAPIICFADPLDCLVVETKFLASQRPCIRSDVADILAKYPASHAAAAAYVATIGAHIPARHSPKLLTLAALRGSVA
jgi:hypothetical protein